VILGTAPYLSPEQARGQQPDKRSDIWAFGCVLFESLTGRQAFPGETIMDVFVSILKSEPDWGLLPTELPPSVQSLLRRCLQKETNQRLPDITHARLTLEDALEDAPAIPQTKAISSWKMATVVGIVAAAVAAAVTWSYRPSSPAAMAVRAAAVPAVPANVPSVSSFSLPTGQQISRTLMSAIAISPDGANMVYVSNDRLHLRSISGTESSVIPGTAGALNPVFSPDGKWIAFWMFNDRSLKKIALTGGAPVPLTPLQIAPSSLNWEGDTLVYAAAGGIFAVPASGGQPEVWVATKPPELANNPQILDGGNAVLFSLTTRTGLDRWDTADIVIFSRKTGLRKVLRQGGSNARYFPSGHITGLDRRDTADIVIFSGETGQRKVLRQGGSDAGYFPSGHIVYVVGNTLFAVPFDLKQQEITGTAVPILDGVMHIISTISSTMPPQPGPRAWPFGVAQFDVSRNGTLVYIPDMRASEVRLIPNWLDQIRQLVRSR
jgi:serine/threonine-protein kinase